MLTRQAPLLLLLAALAACGSGSSGNSAPPQDGQTVDVDGSEPSGGNGGSIRDAGARPPDGPRLLDAPGPVFEDAASISDASVPFDAEHPQGDAPPVSGCQAGKGGNSTLDPRTCLTWQNEKQPPRTNTQAARYCADLALDGFDDWRVPAPEELATWPGLTADSNAYVTGPVYIPTGASPMDGCTTNSHSCNIAEYNPGSISCAWQGVGFMGPSVCVRGTAAPGTSATKYAAGNCDACRSHVAGGGADFKVADCLPFAQ